MNLNNIIINTRIRNGWSAIELGFKFARKFWLRSILLYLTMIIPTYFLLSIINVHATLIFFILWWLKPLFERPLLYCYSRELFSEPMSYINVIKHIRHWLTPRIIWSITIGRITAVRALMAPVALLEPLSFRQFRNRLRVIYRNRYGQAMWLTIVLIHIETLFIYASFVLLYQYAGDIFLDNRSTQYYYTFENTPFLYNLILNSFTIIIMACIAPFYCAAGFMLYISRRIELEGWDIEIHFKRLVAQLDSQSSLYQKRIRG